MKVQGAYLQCFLAILAVAGTAPPIAGQALYTDRLGNGTELVVVVQPLADATTVVWPATVAGAETPTGVTSGDLTLAADIESALVAGEGTPAPPVVVAVGGVSVPDLRALLDRILMNRPIESVQTDVRSDLVEGLVERRLGAPGSEAEIRLEVNLPAPSDPMRSSLEVLCDVLPDVLEDDLGGLRSRIDGDRALVEAKTDPSSSDMAVRKLRLRLAQLAENPAVDAGRVEAAAQRLRVRRQALLEQHPQSAERILELWLSGGADSVREHLFGVNGVTVETVRNAAMAWLPRHPGNIVVTLPPRSFNPRFASPPTVFELDNGLSAAVLERSELTLAALCMRPVVVPDLDGELAATILARLAHSLRELEHRPGWVRVNAAPAQILLAGRADHFSDLAEALQAALAAVDEDRRAVLDEGGSARRRALRLMAGRLGLGEGASLSPATLLRTGNLALGMVGEDSEAASEAIHKFWAFGTSAAVEGATVSTLAPDSKTREAAAGDQSVLVVAAEFAGTADETLLLVVGGLLESRATTLLPDVEFEVLQPFIPGHRALFVVASAEGTLDVVESKLRERWSHFTRPTTEEELAAVRRRVAGTTAAAWSGTVGQACRCAAVASGAVTWRTAADMEMTILSIPLESVDAALDGINDWEALPNTGAGVLPIVELGDR